MEKKAKILIIEDDEEISQELGEYLSRAGYDTVCIRQFSDVAKKALKEAPDLILLDVNLPGIDGLHICEQIRKTSQIPIIFVTGNNTSLHCLFEHPGEVVAREDILDYLWDHDVFIDDNTLSVHITRIRNKLKEIGAPDFIETKRGLGYRI